MLRCIIVVLAALTLQACLVLGAHPLITQGFISADPTFAPQAITPLNLSVVSPSNTSFLLANFTASNLNIWLQVWDADADLVNVTLHYSIDNSTQVRQLRGAGNLTNVRVDNATGTWIKFEWHAEKDLGFHGRSAKVIAKASDALSTGTMIYISMHMCNRVYREHHRSRVIARG